FRGNQVHVLLAKAAILPGVTSVPLKLLPGNSDDRGLALLRHPTHCPGPQGHGDEYQQDTFYKSDGGFDVIRSMVFDADVIGLRITRAMKAEERVRKVAHPADEERDHQPVNVNNQIVNG